MALTPWQSSPYTQFARWVSEQQMFLPIILNVPGLGCLVLAGGLLSLRKDDGSNNSYESQEWRGQ